MVPWSSPVSENDTKPSQQQQPVASAEVLAASATKHAAVTTAAMPTTAALPPVAGTAEPVHKEQVHVDVGCVVADTAWVEALGLHPCDRAQPRLDGHKFVAARRPALLLEDLEEHVAVGALPGGLLVAPPASGRLSSYVGRGVLVSFCIALRPFLLRSASM